MPKILRKKGKRGGVPKNTYSTLPKRRQKQGRPPFRLLDNPAYQETFLDVLSQTGYLGKACESVDMTAKSVNQYRNTHPEFEARVQQSLKIAEGMRVLKNNISLRTKALDVAEQRLENGTLSDTAVLSLLRGDHEIKTAFPWFKNLLTTDIELSLNDISGVNLAALNLEHYLRLHSRGILTLTIKEITDIHATLQKQELTAETILNSLTALYEFLENFFNATSSEKTSIGRFLHEFHTYMVTLFSTHQTSLTSARQLAESLESHQGMTQKLCTPLSPQNNSETPT